MYRWGNRENHSYPLGVFSKKEIAEHIAQCEEDGRGGKYTAEIKEIKVNCILYPMGFDDEKDERRFPVYCKNIKGLGLDGK